LGLSIPEAFLLLADGVIEECEEGSNETSPQTILTSGGGRRHAAGGLRSSAACAVA
jgi:hypothetical protein